MHTTPKGQRATSEDDGRRSWLGGDAAVGRYQRVQRLVLEAQRFDTGATSTLALQGMKNEKVAPTPASSGAAERRPPWAEAKPASFANYSGSARAVRSRRVA